MKNTFAIIEIGSNNTKTHIYEEGKVVSQSRAAGSPIVKGTSLIVTIAKKPTEKPTTPTPPTDSKPDQKDDKTPSDSSGTGDTSSGSSTR